MSQTYKKQAFCPSCQQHVLSERSSGISDGMGCLLTIFTAGFFLPLWILSRMAGSFRSYLCPRCGGPLPSDAAAIKIGRLMLFAVAGTAILVIIYIAFAT